MEYSQIQTIPLIAKPDKDTTKKENYMPIYVIYKDAQILHKTLANQVQQFTKRITHHDQEGFLPGMQTWLSIHKINLIHHTGKIKSWELQRVKSI